MVDTRALRTVTRKALAGAVIVLVVGLVLALVPVGGGSSLPAAAAGIGPVQAAGSAIIPIVFPLPERFPWTNTFGAPRSGNRTHEGNDIMVPKMTPLLAVVDGTLDWMNLTGKLSSYNGLPYYNILLRGDDGNDYFYIHMNNDTPGTDDGLGGVEKAYAPGLGNGTRVTAGQLIGWAGDSGNAEDSGSHIHFEIHQGGYKNPIDPYESLKAAPLVGAGPTPTTPPPTTTTGAPPSTTTTTAPPPTTESIDPGPGGQLDPEIPVFSDVGLQDWFFGDLSLVYVAGIVNGSADGTFRPYGSVTRAHFAAFLARAFASDALTGPTPSTPTFADVPPSFWGYPEIEVAVHAGLVRGTGDGTRFSPNAPITRAQMATMLCRALGLDQAVLAATAVPPLEFRVFTDVPQDYWASLDIAAAYDAGLVAGGNDGRFRPEETTTRAQAAAVIARALRLQEGRSGD
ncbi:MAG: S-layer homology domain-containing protein [Thermoleophilia bacterium]